MLSAILFSMTIPRVLVPEWKGREAYPPPRTSENTYLRIHVRTHKVLGQYTA